MPIYTVSGAIPAEQLGLTSMHEHLLIDGTAMMDDRQLWGSSDAEVSIDTIGLLRWNSHGLRDNLLVDDEAMIIRELKRFAAAGGSAVVDLTNVGIGRKVERLRGIAAATGVHVAVGCGWYVGSTHPPTMTCRSVDELADELTNELLYGLDGTGIRPAIIGEIGTSARITATEHKALSASGQAASRTGSAVNIHVDPHAHEGHAAVDILIDAGMDPARIILSHMDENLDMPYHLELASRGVVLEFDTFGQETYWDYPHRDPTDEQRLTHLADLLSRGLSTQITLGCDVYTKACHREYGGMGYEHLPARIIPALRDRFGISRDLLDDMLINTPRRLLERPNIIELVHLAKSSDGGDAGPVGRARP